MRKLFLALIIGYITNPAVALADEPICHDFSTKIEPDMKRQESDFTSESFKSAQLMLQKTIPGWMEEAFEQNKKHPETYDQLFQGDIALAHANASAIVKGYVLKLEYLAATEEKKETARKAFCSFLNDTPYFD